ncbi:guanylate kinase [Streptomyces bauhiniae]|uniref:Guanylate kinase n=1 Tax=Streptomyces bauhiniae TaxID=2340725 RepID=A0A4Z1DFP0_9ACTN|nr:guanylate kinase [Streptomyces bauhiniae]TGN81311.1 guanylate kinase [Streptomyces bauhiniae]
MKAGILLYGPPASGKDTISAALTEQDPGLVQFQRLKIGPGRTHGYRLGTQAQLEQLEAEGLVLYRNDRYDSVYLVDRPGLEALFGQGRTPVIHLGQLAGIHALQSGYRAAWLTVRLDCSREVTAARSVARGDTDTSARLAAWDATSDDLRGHDPAIWDLHIRTDQHDPAESAETIRRTLASRERSVVQG